MHRDLQKPKHRAIAMAITMPNLFCVCFCFCFVSLLLFGSSDAVRFVLSKEECFTENVEYDGDLVHVSFVVITYEHGWNYQQETGAIDLSVCDA